MSILAGIGFLILTSLCTRIASGIIPLIILTGISAYSFSLWYTFFILSICLAMMLGKPVGTDIYNSSSIRNRYGLLFDILAIVSMIISIALLIKSFF